MTFRVNQTVEDCYSNVPVKGNQTWVYKGRFWSFNCQETLLITQCHENRDGPLRARISGGCLQHGYFQLGPLRAQCVELRFITSVYPWSYALHPSAKMLDRPHIHWFPWWVCAQNQTVPLDLSWGGLGCGRRINPCPKRTEGLLLHGRYSH